MTSQTQVTHRPPPLSGSLDQARDAGTQAAADARDVATDAQNRGAALLEEGKTHALSLANEQKTNAATRLGDLADALNKTSTQLTGDKAWIGDLMKRGASELTGVADTLRTEDLGSLVSKVQGFARRQPAVFVGASLLAGFALVRFGKVAAAGASADDLPHMPEIHHDA